MIPTIAGSRLEDIEAVSGVPRFYLVHNEALEKILFDRNLVGLEFRNACFDASCQFVGHMLDEEIGNVAELIILSKGIVYQLASAFGAVAGKNLPANFIATSRVAASAEDASIEVTYSRFDAGSTTLIIGDTVASGATIVAALETYLQYQPLSRVYIVSCAGSLRGARRIYRYCLDRNIEVSFLYGLAAFGLAENGFDLSFLHPDTICDSNYRDRAASQFADLAVSAVGWDFGSQTIAPHKYRNLCWLEAEKWGLLGSQAFQVAVKPEDWSTVARESIALKSTGDGL